MTRDRTEVSLHRLAMGLFVLSLLLAPAAASPQNDDGWEHRLTLYMLGAAQSGTTSVRGIEADVDLSFSDILSNLEIGGMLHFRSQNKRWAVQVDTIYMALESEADGLPIVVDFDQTVIELMGAYRFSPEFEFLFGTRYNRIGGGLTGTAIGIVDLSGSESWFDPVLGIGWTPRISESWMARVRADVGGFGVGSDFAYQVIGTLGWDFARSWSLLFGYRYLEMDYEAGSKLRDFKYDVATSGPTVGVSFRF